MSLADIVLKHCYIISVHTRQCVGSDITICNGSGMHPLYF